MFNRRKIFTALAAATMVAGLTAGTAAAATPTTGTQQGAEYSAAGCGYYSGTALTVRGNTGNRVKEVQCLLISWGFNIGPDGIDGNFGANTEGAVRQFQSWYGGLTTDGKVGTNTWRALRS
ncbi:peptidoglycan-binding domain-containing protein [Streptomyces sp. TE33382]